MTKRLEPILLFTLSWAAVVNSEGGDGKSLPCIQKLMPCQPYLYKPTPPPTCCGPVKEMVTSDLPCLCQVFSDPALLKTFNVTQYDALKFVKSCGANVDPAVCKKGSSPSHKSAASATSSYSSYAGGCVAAILSSLRIQLLPLLPS